MSLCHFFLFSFYLPLLVPALTAENINLVKSGLKSLQEPMNDCRYSLIKVTHSFNSLIALLMYVYNVYCTVGIHILFTVYMPSIYNSRRGFKCKSSTSRSTSIFSAISLEHKCESELEYRVMIGCGLWLRCGIFGYKTKDEDRDQDRESAKIMLSRISTGNNAQLRHNYN